MEEATSSYFSKSLVILQDSHRNDFKLIDSDHQKSKEKLLPSLLFEDSSSEASGVDDDIVDVFSLTYLDIILDKDTAASTSTGKRSRQDMKIAENNKKSKAMSRDGQFSDPDSDRCNPRRQKKVSEAHIAKKIDSSTHAKEMSLQAVNKSGKASTTRPRTIRLKIPKKVYTIFILFH